MVALGREPSSEYRENLHKVGGVSVGNRTGTAVGVALQDVVGCSGREGLFQPKLCVSMLPRHLCAPVSQVSKHLRGEVGLLFTNRTKEEVDE